MNKEIKPAYLMLIGAAIIVISSLFGSAIGGIISIAGIIFLVIGFANWLSGMGRKPKKADQSEPRES
jgi:uncharacterized membrane protein